AIPSISPNGGSFTNSVQVTLTCATAGAEIRYTTDGSVPTAASTLYNGPFTLSANATINAFATASGFNNSALFTSNPFIIVQAQTPSANDQTVTTLITTPKTLTLTGSDPTPLALTYTILTQPAHGVVQGQNPTQSPGFTYSPNTGFSGTDSFTFKVSNNYV